MVENYGTVECTGTQSKDRLMDHNRLFFLDFSVNTLKEQLISTGEDLVWDKVSNILYSLPHFC